MNLPKSRYDQTKVNDTPRILEPMAVQDVFSVLSIDESGVFELMDKKFSKLYVLSDMNFAGVTDEEQKNIIVNFSNVLKAIPCRFSYMVANEYVDERAFHEKILYQKKGDKYDDLRKSFNQVISDKVSDARQGLYQTIYLTLTIEAMDIPDYFKSGYYFVNGVGLFRYVSDEDSYVYNGKPYDEAVDWNDPIILYNEDGTVKYDPSDPDFAEKQKEKIEETSDPGDEEAEPTITPREELENDSE